MIWKEGIWVHTTTSEIISEDTYETCVLGHVFYKLHSEWLSGLVLIDTTELGAKSPDVPRARKVAWLLRRIEVVVRFIHFTI